MKNLQVMKWQQMGMEIYGLHQLNQHSEAIVLAIPMVSKDRSCSGVTDSQTFHFIWLIQVIEDKQLLRWSDGLCFGPDEFIVHYEFCITCEVITFNTLKKLW